MWGMTPPPEIVALMSTSSSSSPLGERVTAGGQEVSSPDGGFLPPDGELEVARRDPPSLQVLRRVPRQLQDLGEKDSSTSLFFMLGFLPTSAVRYSRMAAV